MAERVGSVGNWATFKCPKCKREERQLAVARVWCPNHVKKVRMEMRMEKRGQG